MCTWFHKNQKLCSLCIGLKFLLGEVREVKIVGEFGFPLIGGGDDSIERGDKKKIKMEEKIGFPAC